MNGLKLVQVTLVGCIESLTVAQRHLASTKDAQAEQFLDMVQEVSRCNEVIKDARRSFRPGDSTKDLHLLLELIDERLILNAALVIVMWHLTLPGELKSSLWTCHEHLEKASDIVESVKSALPLVGPSTQPLN